MTDRLRVRSYRRSGRLVPRAAKGLRARSVALGRGQIMDWHSTRHREELLLALTGRVEVEVQARHPSRTGPRTRRMPLKPGECLFLPQQTMHRVLNRAAIRSCYVYVTA